MYYEPLKSTLKDVTDQVDHNAPHDQALQQKIAIMGLVGKVGDPYLLFSSLCSKPPVRNLDVRNPLTSSISVI